MRALVIVAAAGSAIACGKATGRRAAVVGDAAAATTTAAASACTVPRAPWRLPAAKRVIAFGDLHGDRDAGRRALALAGVIDAQDRWIGGDATVVQLGDVLDRGDDEQAIIDWFERLEGEAAAAGGRFVWLLGNHELMNPAGDFRYVTPGGFRDFEDVPDLPLDRFADVPPAARARVAAFAPGGPYARILSGQHVAAIVGDTAFVHGGILPGVAAGLDDADQATRCWLAGQGPPPAIADDPAGPLWDRSLAGDVVDCDVLGRALAELGVARMVIAHTVQDGGITSRCDGRVWRVDVGLAHLYGGPTQVLELVPGAAPRVVK